MARVVTGIDVGTRTAKALRGRVEGNSFAVTGFAVADNAGGTVASGWESLEPGFKPGSARVGVTGREVNVRYTRVPRVPDWQLKKLMRFETEEVAGQSEAAVASDFNVLPEIPEIEGEDVVLLAMARESLLEEHAGGLAALGGKLDAFTPNAIALYNAWLRFGVVMDDTVLVANVGRESTDVVVVRGTDLLFARNLSGGSRLFDEAIAQRFGVGERRAEEVKRSMATLEPGASFDDPNAEKASRALLGPAGQVQSLLQSAVLFCKTQVKLTNLKLDRVMLCGGGARLRGLPQWLSKTMSVPVELFDPFQVVDTSKLSPEDADLLEEHRLESVVALGLATSASDPEAYSIEILPAAVERRRELVHGTSFLAAAGVLAVAYLGLFAWKSHADLAQLRSEVQSLERQARRATSVDQETRNLLDDNRDLAARAASLHALAGSTEQLHRALAALHRHLPEDFWIEKLSSSSRRDEELGIPRGEELPVLHVEGRAREGTVAPSVQFGELVDALRRDLPGVRMKEQMGATGASFAIDLTLLAPRAAGDADSAEAG